MKKYVKFFLMLFIPCLIDAHEVDELIKKFPEVSFSILAKDLTSGEILYSYNPDKLMIPGSTTKLFTGYAALSYLGKEFVYKTQVFEKNNQFYLKFSGDPSFTLNDLDILIKKIPKYNNLKKIFVDDSFFDQVYFGNGWAWDDKKFCYSSPISSIVINNNCFNGVIEPGGAIKTEKAFIKIRNNLVSKAEITCNPDLVASSDNSYEFNGCINIAKPINLSIAYQDPRLMLKDILKTNFKIDNVEFENVPSKAKLIYEHFSEPLSVLVNKMIKESNNTYAESFFKTMGAKYYKTQGSFDVAKSAIKEFYPSYNFKIVDGSGASRYNLISSRQFVELLSRAYENKEFVGSLPISGVDGTLKNRFTSDIKFQNIVMAKSGKLTGINCLAGYVEKNIVFSIMINNFLFSTKEAQELQEQILSKITEDPSVKFEVIDR